MEAITNRARDEKRAMTEDEISSYDALDAQAKAVEADIDSLESDETRRRELTERRQRTDTSRRQVPSEDPRSLGVDTDMSQDDIRRYSLLRAISASISNDWHGAELEREASAAVAKALRRSPRGFFVPHQVLQAQYRDLTVAGEGANIVATDLLAGSFVEMLTNRMIVRQMGATVISGLVGDIDIPSQIGGVTAYWVDETTQVTEGNVDLDQINMTPKTIGAYTEVTRKMLLQSSIDVEVFLRNDLALALALGIDLSSLHGTGSGNDQPLGIAGTSGVGAVPIGTNGGAMIWDHVVDLESEVAADNADVGRIGYLTNALMRGYFKKTPKVAANPVFMWDQGTEPLNGYRVGVTNQASSALT
jgi:HK97 family phage major capsid protein